MVTFPGVRSDSGRRLIVDILYATRMASFTFSPNTKCQGNCLFDDTPYWKSLFDSQELARHSEKGEAKDVIYYNKKDGFDFLAMLEAVRDREARSEMPQ